MGTEDAFTVTGELCNSQTMALSVADFIEAIDSKRSEAQRKRVGRALERIHELRYSPEAGSRVPDVNCGWFERWLHGITPVLAAFAAGRLLASRSFPKKIFCSATVRLPEITLRARES